MQRAGGCTGQGGAGRVLAQRRSIEVAFGYLTALAPGVKATCWAIAEEAGHEGPRSSSTATRPHASRPSTPGSPARWRTA